MRIQKKDTAQHKIVTMLIIIGVLSRILPHVPNVNLLTSISLLAGKNFSRIMAFFILFCILVFSDIGLALLFGYPLFGYWTLFTYTGFAIITFFSSKLKYSPRTLPVFIFSSSLGFWVWTNFGVWIVSGMYSKTLFGLANCYIAALPFLGNALLGDMAWGLVIYVVFDLVKTEFYNKQLCVWVLTPFL